MDSITLRFYAGLNDHLPEEHRFVRFAHRCERTSAKDIIESLGVPSAEVELLLVNREPSDLSRVLAHGDDVAVYPAFESLDLSARSRSRTWLAAFLVPLLLVWMLPQTLAGAVIALWRWTRPRLVRFGPLVCLVVPARPPGAAGISLGLITFAEHPSIVRHELCHVITGLWLGWLYLPVYGLEYLILGHRRSWHERITCWLETRVPWPVQNVSGEPKSR